MGWCSGSTLVVIVQCRRLACGALAEPDLPRAWLVEEIPADWQATLQSLAVLPCIATTPRCTVPCIALTERPAGAQAAAHARPAGLWLGCGADTGGWCGAGML
jgi:hypothetical protein